MFRDAKAKVARLGEVALLELVLLDLEAALQDLLGLGAPHRHVHRDLLVAADAECSDGVPGFACVLLAALAATLMVVVQSCSGRVDGYGAAGSMIDHHSEGGLGDESFKEPTREEEIAYCRQGSVHSAAPTPWQLGSICHRTRRRRC